MTQREDVAVAIEQLGGIAHIREIKEQLNRRGTDAAVRTILGKYPEFVNLNPGSGMWALQEYTKEDADIPDFLEDPELDLGDPEGERVLRRHWKAERSIKLVRAFKKSLQSFKCEACQFDFGKRYGTLWQRVY